MTDRSPSSYRVEPDAEFAARLERVLVQRLTAPSDLNTVTHVDGVSWIDATSGRDRVGEREVPIDLSPAVSARRSARHRAAWKAALGVAAVAVMAVALAAIVRVGDEPEPADVPPVRTTAVAPTPETVSVETVETAETQTTETAATVPPTVTATTALVTVPSLGSATSGGMWPQATLDEAQAAQRLADAGDPAFTWQLDATLADDDEPAADQQPWTAGVVARFLEEGLGWEEFRSLSGMVYVPGGGFYAELVFLRCAPGETNPLSPLYAEIPAEIRTCAPTIDELTYDTVTLDIRQPAHLGQKGIWVVDQWHKLMPNPDVSVFNLINPDFTLGQVTQVAPPSDAEVTELLDAFLGARVAGEGAEQYLLRESEESSADEEVPLLYIPSAGVPYERFEIEVGEGPVWPSGWTDYRVRLFAQGDTVVEQYFYVVRKDGRLWVVHRQWERQTTENGQPAAVPYRLLDGEVTFAATPPWHRSGDYCSKLERSAAVGLDAHCVRHVRIAPGAPTIQCQDDPAASATAEALAASFRADPRFDTTEPVPVRVAGADGLQMDVTVTEDFVVCGLERNTGRMRLILIDLPEGMSVPTLMISVVAPAEQFDAFVQDAQAIIDSIEFHHD